MKFVVFKILLLIIFLAFSYGFLVPMLVSYPDTLLVLIGLCYAILVAPFITWIVVDNIRKFFKAKMEG